MVCWARPGVGAVATQGLVEVAYGPRGLEHMASGDAAATALHTLLAEDESEAVRQVAMVDVHGRVAVHTGARAIAHAGHRVGEGVSVQANMMRSDGVPDAMLAAWRESRGPLAERMLACLDAAEQAGGDLRGRQSAAMCVVAAKPGDDPLTDRPVDLRVDDHPEPLAELRRLLVQRRAYDHQERGENLAAAGDLDGALTEFDAAGRLAPGNTEIAFWRGVALTSLGRPGEAKPLLDSAFAQDEGWKELYGRLPDAGLLAPEHGL